ncbi:MAG: hypothetical protein ACOYJK_04350 [Prevotella sp.]|jgi:hypothetical protein
MDLNFSYYLFVLIAVIVGVIIVKKVTGCLFRLIWISVIVAALVYIYLTYFQ